MIKHASIIAMAFAWWFALYDPVDWPKGTIAPPDPWEDHGNFRFWENCELSRRDFIRHFPLKKSQGVTKCVYYRDGQGMRIPELKDLDVKPKTAPRKPWSRS